MTNNIQQKTLDHIIKSMRLQGRRAAWIEDGELFAAYRDGHGHKCAVGMCIADEYYDVEFENEPAIDPRVQAAVTMSGFDPVVATALQPCHDDALHESPFLAAFEQSARYVAEDLGLTYPEK